MAVGLKVLQAVNWKFMFNYTPHLIPGQIIDLPTRYTATIDIKFAGVHRVVTVKRGFLHRPGGE